MLLKNLNVLVCEDEPLIAMDVEFELAEAGATTLIAPTVKRGLFILRTHRLDAAVLDLNLRDGDSTLIAEQLDQQKIPYLIYSGVSKSFPRPPAAGELVKRLAILAGRLPN